MSLHVTPQAPWSLPVEAIIKTLGKFKDGLTQKEATLRLKIQGRNTLPGRSRATSATLVFKQLKSPLIAILLIAGGVSIALSEYINAGVLFATVFINVALGYWQENKAESVLEALKQYTKTLAHVLRDGIVREIDAEELVTGDVIRLTAGVRVPADARILASTDLQADESVLTGESLPVNKNPSPQNADAPISDRTCMLHGGTLIAQGIADAVVIATGEQMEFGRIALLVSEKEAPTPLQRSVSIFAKQISFFLLLLCIGLFGIGLWTGHHTEEMFFIAVAVAVSAVPEGLPVALTVILASGVERLAKRKGVVRKLLAAETLGSTSLILTDKTGTLTMGKMSLVDVHALHETDDQLLQNAILATDIIIENPTEKPERWHILGKAMEEALVRGAATRGQRLPDLMKSNVISKRIPFNSIQKYSGVTINKTKEIFLGGPDVLILMCTISPQDKSSLLAQIEEQTKTGGRLLGVATRENGTMEFSGWLVFRDPLRAGITEAIQRISTSGVRTVMVTGDHPGTALAIAQTLGLINGHGGVITGIEIDQLNDKALMKRLPSLTVFARTTPEHKLRLVKLYQALGEVVAVTGDGVNDAPALRAADVGVAMGSGTDAAKAASDLVILDDKYSTIVIAIEEGRRILDNIRKALSYLLSNAFSELVLIGGSMIFGLPLPLSALQILFVNFFSDSFPAIAYAFEDMSDSNRRHPRYSGNLLDQRSRFIIFVIGSLSSVTLLTMHIWLLNAGFESHIVRSFTFMAFGTYTLFVSLSLRSLHKPIWSYSIIGNIPLAIGVLVGLSLMIGAIYLPWLNTILDTVPLSWPWLLGVLGFGLANIAAIEITKIVYKNIE
ncbi:MAG: HAD-IC family P-type ATPase [Candidatus Uhrbacteria bacterium]